MATSAIFHRHIFFKVRKRIPIALPIAHTHAGKVLGGEILLQPYMKVDSGDDPQKTIVNRSTLKARSEFTKKFLCLCQDCDKHFKTFKMSLLTNCVCVISRLIVLSRAMTSKEKLTAAPISTDLVLTNIRSCLWVHDLPVLLFPSFRVHGVTRFYPQNVFLASCGMHKQAEGRRVHRKCPCKMTWIPAPTAYNGKLYDTLLCRKDSRRQI